MKPLPHRCLSTRSAKFRSGLYAGLALLAGSLTSTASAAEWKIAPGLLTTRWAAEVSPDHPLPEYPRPQLTRPDWLNLNGLWDYALSGADATTKPDAYPGKILVPFPYEAALSGVGQASPTTQRLWYHRTFTIPPAWAGERVLLHFGAVNWDCSVFVNGKAATTHKGGYTAFEADVTDLLATGSNELVVSAANPVRVNEADSQVLGKQRKRSEGIFYTATTGIWQTVWLEPVPQAYIVDLKLIPDVDARVLHVTVRTAAAGAATQIVATAKDGTTASAQVNGQADGTVDIPVPNPHLWSPDDPHLYGLDVALVQNGKTVDHVGSYFAMRKVSLGKDEKGRNRIFINNRFLLQIGLLDQGYWPDGNYTAPTDDALKSDIEVSKKLGYNLLRKHAKVEPDRWYYWCDKLGLLVWQDMPQAFGAKGTGLSEEAKAQWLTEWKAEIAQFYNAPSIIVWTTFNEGWGQHDTEEIVALTKQLDPTRLVNNASGWTDKKVGDIADTHAYPGPWSGKPEETRAAVNGEFGGITETIQGHTWSSKVKGYGSVLQSKWLATARYLKLLKTAYKLSDDLGTSAFVYTQLSDVEQEVNGILTYDRAEMKLDESVLARANRGLPVEMPPNPNPDLVPNAQAGPVTWRYTLANPGDDWQKADFDDSKWQSGSAPFGHDFGQDVRTEWTTGDIWMRRHFTLPAQVPPKLAFTVHHDEDTQVSLNGVPAATIPAYNADYVTVPIIGAARAALKPGDNVIAVHNHNTTGGQGIDIGITEAAH